MIISLAKIELKTEDKPTKYRFIVSINGHKMHEGVHVEEISALEKALERYKRIFE